MGKQCTFIAAIVLLVLFFPPLLSAGEILLYDADENQLPSVQPWLSYYSLGGVATEQLVADGVRLTTSSINQSGYSNHAAFPQALKNPDFPALNRKKGVKLHFQLQVHAESHGSADRAGFSILLLADDKKGVEIAFWEDEIWAQTDAPVLFNHGESAAFDTTAGLIQYKLAMQDETYILYQNGIQILTGRVKDYSAFNAGPYILPNFLFLGDNTSSAQADVTLGKVKIVTDTLFHWHMFLQTMRGLRQDVQ